MSAMTAVIFFLVLSALVLAHELGHYLAARLCGVKAHEFGLGLPPRLIGWVKDGKRWKLVRRGGRDIYKRTIISLNWLPFGGFVRLKGEAAGEDHDHDSLLAKPLGQRAFVMAAGVLMNWLVAALLLSIVLAHGTTTSLDGVPSGAHVADARVQVAEVLDGSPAALAGLASGDVIVAINGDPAGTARAARDRIRYLASAGPVFLQFRHQGQDHAVNLMPVVLAELNAPGIGVGLEDIGLVSFGPLDAIVQGTYLAGRMTRDVVWALGGLVRDLVVTRHVTQDVAGPVGIAVMTGEAARTGFTTLLQFAAMLSINLAVINVLPIPALDGGRLFFLLIEKLRRRPMNRLYEIRIQNIAYVLLILLILLVTVRDVGRYGGPMFVGLKHWLSM